MQDLLSRLNTCFELSSLQDALNDVYTSVTRYVLCVGASVTLPSKSTDSYCQCEPVVIVVTLKYVTACALQHGSFIFQ